MLSLGSALKGEKKPAFFCKRTQSKKRPPDNMKNIEVQRITNVLPLCEDLIMRIMRCESRRYVFLSVCLSVHPSGRLYLDMCLWVKIRSVACLICNIVCLRVYVCLCVCVRACVLACVLAYARARARVCVCVCVLDYFLSQSTLIQ